MAGMFKGILVIVCFAGYINYFVNVKRYSIFVVPAVVVTSVSGCLYIAGLINIMPLFVYLSRNMESLFFSVLSYLRTCYISRQEACMRMGTR